MASYYQEEQTTYMPMSQDFYNSYYMPPPHQYAEQACQAPLYYQSYPQAQQYAPPLPPKEPIRPYSQTSQHQPPSLHSSHSSGSPRSPQFPPTPPPGPSLEPDPLPPHSNPQALTQSQSRAFTNSRPIEAVRIGKDEVYSTKTGFAQYVITREGKHMPSFLSTKPILTIRRTSTGHTVGQIKYHTLTTSSIDMTVNGRQTTISHHVHGFLQCKRWGFKSTTTSVKGEKWYWKKDKSTGGAMLEDSPKHKHATCLARMKGDLLTFERGHLSDASYDEIVMSAVAMAEAARRAGKGKDVADVASAIGDFAASGGSVGGSSGGVGGDGGE